MIQKLKSMKVNKKGFTLAELLIVVAIIAVLAAIAVPIFTSQLNDAKAKVDMANARAAESLAMSDYLLHQNDTDYKTLPVYYKTEIDGNNNLTITFNKTTDVAGIPSQANPENHLHVSITAGGKVFSEWK